MGKLNSMFGLIKYDLSKDNLLKLTRKKAYFHNPAIAKEVVAIFEENIYQKQREDHQKRGFFTGFWFLVKYLVPFLKSPEKADLLNEVQIRKLLEAHGSDQVKLDMKNIIDGLTSEYNLGEMGKIVDVTAVVKVILLVLFLMLVILVSGFGERIRILTEVMNPTAEVYLFQTVIGITFQVVAIAAFFWGIFVIPIRKLVQFRNNNLMEKDKQFRENFLYSAPTQIMNLGIITMIFAIVGIIYFEKNQLLDMSVYFHWQLYDIFHAFNPDQFQNFSKWGFNMLTFLVVAGGFTEAAAFYLGYKFPDKFKTHEEEKELKIDEAFAEKLAQALKDKEVVAEKVDAEMIAQGVLDALKKVNLIVEK